MYKHQLKALKKTGRFRERNIFDDNLVDFASNDYLGFASKKKQLKKAVKLVEQYSTIAPKSSMLVNGYHPIHRKFEESIAKLNGFESGIVVGSGFLANMALIESLVRKGDLLFMDEEYHASGMMAAQIHRDRTILFAHNDAKDLREKIARFGRTQLDNHRNIIAIEGIYSMSGEVCTKEIFEVADDTQALLIVDEAHSSGVLGDKLLGVFEYYDIKPKENHIKMGTLGKAYGSYGAYILGSGIVISFLENRAKPIIYSTAPSVIDTALALVNILDISKNHAYYTRRIKKRQRIIEDKLSIKCHSLIVPIDMPNNTKALQLQQILIEKGYLVGAIRQPTVAKPILRIIPRLGTSKKALKKLLNAIEKYQNLVQYHKGAI